jgi:hypothetical protein
MWMTVGSSAVRKGDQPPWIVPDGLSERIEPLLRQVERRRRYPGRRRPPDAGCCAASCSCSVPASHGNPYLSSWASGPG